MLLHCKLVTWVHFVAASAVSSAYAAQLPGNATLLLQVDHG
jgi:hypothetical protein